MGRRGCASAMGMIKFPSSCSSPKALCNQFIDYYICSRGVFCINHIKLRNFVVITIECSIATVDRGSIMTRIYRWSMMVYSISNTEIDSHICHLYSVIWCLRYIPQCTIYINQDGRQLSPRKICFDASHSIMCKTSQICFYVFEVIEPTSNAICQFQSIEKGQIMLTGLCNIFHISSLSKITYIYIFQYSCNL